MLPFIAWLQIVFLFILLLYIGTAYSLMYKMEVMLSIELNFFSSRCLCYVINRKRLLNIYSYCKVVYIVWNSYNKYIDLILYNITLFKIFVCWTCQSEEKDILIWKIIWMTILRTMRRKHINNVLYRNTIRWGGDFLKSSIESLELDKNNFRKTDLSYFDWYMSKSCIISIQK